MNVLDSSDRIRDYLEGSKKELDETEVFIQVLGTAQDGGFPHISCYCRNCLWARNEGRFSRLISSLAILDLTEKEFFLVDATPDIKIQLDLAIERLGYRKRDPDAVFLTHAHIGHYTGLMYFGFEALSTQNMPVFCSSRMKSFLVNNGPWNQLVQLENIIFQNLTPGKEIVLTSQISLTPFLVPHRDEYSDTLGFIISGKKRRLLYIPDIESWDVWDCSIVEEVKKVDVAILDGTFYNSKELPGRDLSQIGHPFIKDSIKTLENVIREGKTEIYFTHLNHTNSTLNPTGETRKKIAEKGFRIANDGMEFFL